MTRVSDCCGLCIRAHGLAVCRIARRHPSSGRPGEETTAANTELTLLGSDKKVDCAGQGMALGLNDLIACIGA
ncbi:MAG: hypothetical protein ACXVE9_18680, partial [Solirubrobacteraceae bacterium]